jgi:hypothetical protein
MDRSSAWTDKEAITAKHNIRNVFLIIKAKPSPNNVVPDSFHVGLCEHELMKAHGRFSVKVYSRPSSFV